MTSAGGVIQASGGFSYPAAQQSECASPCVVGPFARRCSRETARPCVVRAEPSCGGAVNAVLRLLYIPPWTASWAGAGICPAKCSRAPRGRRVASDGATGQGPPLPVSPDSLFQQPADLPSPVVGVKAAGAARAAGLPSPLTTSRCATASAGPTAPCHSCVHTTRTQVGLQRAGARTPSSTTCTATAKQSSSLFRTASPRSTAAAMSSSRT